MLTRRIVALEDDLGRTLLVGVRLTSARPPRLIVDIRRIFAYLDAVTRAARCNPLGKVGEPRLGVRMPPVEPAAATSNGHRGHHGPTLRNEAE